MEALWRTSLRRVQSQLEAAYASRMSQNPPGRLSAMLIERVHVPTSKPIDIASIPGITKSGPHYSRDRLQHIYTCPDTYRKIQQVFDAKGNAVFTDKPMLDIHGNPIVNSAGDAFLMRPGTKRTTLLFGSIPLASECRQAAIDAGRCLRGVASSHPDLILPENVSEQDQLTWFYTVFELAWRQIPGSPLLAEKLVWSGPALFRLNDLPRFRGQNWPKGLADSVARIPDPPDQWFSELQDIIGASIQTIDIILEQTAQPAPRPIAPDDSAPVLRKSEKSEPKARPKKSRRPPSDLAVATYRIWFPLNLSQEEIASLISKKVGYTVKQNKVSRMLKQVKLFLAAGNDLPALPKPSARSAPIDPSKIDLGERSDRLTKRQRNRQSDSE
jgi:hypothetical protein